MRRRTSQWGGGALVINDPETVTKAEILREKGTNRASFLRGQVDKYTWVSYGSSYLPSDLNAAYLWAQLEQADTINTDRTHSWDYYAQELAPLAEAGLLSCPPCRKAVCITGICSMSSCGTWNSAPRSLPI